MATRLYPGSGAAPSASTPGLGHNNPMLSGVGNAWQGENLRPSMAGGSSIRTVNTIAGPTNGVEVTASAGGLPIEFISDPVSADVTISGTITINIWAAESNMSANVAINAVIEVIRAVDNTLVQIAKSARTTEVAVTTRAVNNFTVTPTSTVVNKGDRLRVRVFGDDAGTMATGFTFSVSFNGGTGGADGDTWVEFTETITFEDLTTDPTGTTLYLTNSASAVSTPNVDREAWTSRGAGVQNDVTNTALGWTAPIQVTDTPAGSAVDWWTRPLQAFTLGGLAKANLRCANSEANNAALRCEIARVNGDGTGEVVWATWDIEKGSDGFGAAGTTEEARIAWVSGDDLAISDGQRLRIRIYLDDRPAAAMHASQTLTFYYAGTTGGASGDSFIILPQTVSEFVSATPGPVWERRPGNRFLVKR